MKFAQNIQENENRGIGKRMECLGFRMVKTETLQVGAWRRKGKESRRKWIQRGRRRWGLSLNLSLSFVFIEMGIMGMCEC